MFRRLLSRATAWLTILLVAGFLAASLVRLAPGFGMDERLLDARLGAESREALTSRASGERNVLHFYTAYLTRLLHADFGESVALSRPVRDLLAERLPVTTRSAAAGLALAWFGSVLAVFILEFHPRRVAERLASAATGALLSLPAAIAALLCVYAGAGPAIAIALIVFPRVFRYARNIAGEARRAPHVLAAHAMGIGRCRILAFHVAAPVLPDLLALAGVSVSMAIGATIPVEALCDSPGVGHLVWQAALSRDLPVLVNVTLLITAVTAGANLLADLARAPHAAQA